MAYSTSNPPRLVWSGIGKGPRHWVMEGTDANTAVQVSGYITNAKTLGLRAGDTLTYVKTDASPVAAWLYIVSAINSNGSGDLSNGLAITATNSD